MPGTRNKKIDFNIWVSLILAIVSVVVVWLVVFRQNDNKKAESYFTGKVNKFCFNKVCIDNSGGSWFVSDGMNQYPANSDLADTYANRFQEIYLDKLISVNPERFGDLGIGSTDRVILEIGSKQLEIGKVNANYNGVYVRRPDEDKVYDTKVILDKTNLSIFTYWQNRTITNLAIPQIIKISLENNGRNKDFLPNAGKWDDQTWVDKIAHLGATNFINVPENKTAYLKFTVSTEKETTIFYIGQMVVDGYNLKYWATTDNKLYYEISKDDYKTLTGKTF